MRSGLLTLVAFVCLLSPITTLAENEAPSAPQPEFTEPLFKPFIERYVLDELKSLRQDQLMMRTEIAERVASARLESSDRALRYTTDTVNNIFYIITAAASILVLLGWRSIRDIKDSVESTTSAKILEVTREYESRLNALEASLRERSNQIMAAQQEISDTNLVHSLWMRAGLERSSQEKVKLYDQILEVNTQDVEALTYKADALLDLNDDNHALTLTNQALDLDKNYALAYWQRACARSKLGQQEEAITDLERAIELSSSLRTELGSEVHFNDLHAHPRFLALQPLVEPTKES